MHIDIKKKQFESLTEGFSIMLPGNFFQEGKKYILEANREMAIETIVTHLDAEGWAVFKKKE